jgi:hypothetical protein
MTRAAYDAIADWYEREFLDAQAEGDPIARRFRRPQRPGGRDHPARLPRRPLDHRVVDSHGVRDKVGATHLTLPELLHAFLDAGLVLDRFTEGGGPIPVMFGVRAGKR